MEQEIHGMDESCLSTLLIAGSFQLDTVHGAGNPHKVPTRGAAARVAQPRLGDPRADATVAQAHATRLPDPAHHLPGTGQEREPARSALVETWKTICR